MIFKALQIIILKYRADGCGRAAYDPQKIQSITIFEEIDIYKNSH